SRFLAEIPAVYLITKGGKQEAPRVSAASWATPATVRPPESKPNTGDFSPADKVKHPKFGEGTVVNVVKKGDDTQVTIAFTAPHGIKTLSLLYAPIQKLS
ncbi:MAG: ATP-dependent DNA helicase PcrA, partial [Bacillota bacterium]|nr:ATP-dependent DNA helicase PcrA [Bacillota bacterium]